MSDVLIKLVRDRISDVAPPGEVGFKDIPYPTQHIEELRKKLLEEVGEYLMDQTLEELADVYEVVMALASVAHPGVPHMIREAEKKRVQRGGFSHGTGMYVVRVD